MKYIIRHTEKDKYTKKEHVTYFEKIGGVMGPMSQCFTWDIEKAMCFDSMKTADTFIKKHGIRWCEVYKVKSL